MSLQRVGTDADVLNEVNSNIEIPLDREPVKYEVDKATGAIEAADLGPMIRDQIAHFFDHHRDPEQAKWVDLEGWSDARAARDEILAAIARYEALPEKPDF